MLLMQLLRCVSVASLVAAALVFALRLSRAPPLESDHDGAESATEALPRQQSPMDIVVAYYNKPGIAHWHILTDMQTIRQAKPRWFIYNKNAPNHSFAWVREFPHSDIVVRQLPNVGYEPQTYLHHIVQHYDDSLARHTIFCQENHPYAVYFRRLEYLFDANTSFINLSQEHPCVLREAQSPPWTCKSNSELCGFIRYVANTTRRCVAKYWSALNGCFLVSAEAIRRKPKYLYAELLEMAEANLSTAVYGGPIPIKILDKMGVKQRALPGFTPLRPRFALTMERLWVHLFSCPLLHEYGEANCARLNASTPAVRTDIDGWPFWCSQAIACQREQMVD